MRCGGLAAAGACRATSSPGRASAANGDLLEEHPDALAGEVEVAGVEVDADGVSAVPGGDGERCPAARERVEHKSVTPRFVAAIGPPEGGGGPAHGRLARHAGAIRAAVGLVQIPPDSGRAATAPLVADVHNPP